MVDIDCGHWVTSEKPEDFRQGMLFALIIEKDNADI
jgi:hypothetical protein